MVEAGGGGGGDMAREDIWWIGYIHQQAFRRGSGNMPVDTIMQKGKAIPEQTAIGLSVFLKIKRFFSYLLYHTVILKLILIKQNP